MQLRASASAPSSDGLRRVERAISFIRLGVVVFNALTYLTLSGSPENRREVALVLIGVALVYAVAAVTTDLSAKLSQKRISIVNTILDNLLIALWLWATGGFSSPYFPLFYAESAASVGRFGLIGGGFSAVGATFLYALVAVVDGSAPIFDLVVRVGYIFVIGAFVGYVVVASQRLERVAATTEAELKANQELARLKGTFVSNISHELRTPLTAIRGATTTLLGEPSKLDARQRISLLEIIDRRSTHLARLIQNLLTFGLMDEGKLSLSVSTVDIEKMLSTVVREIGREYDRHVELVTDVDELKVRCDPAKLDTAIRMVLDNALKFSLPNSPVAVRLSDNEEEANITVSNEGAGIPADKREKIFDSFYQVDSSLTRPKEGAGMGLSIARRFLRLHGGDVTLTRTDGDMIEFSLRFPKNPARDAVTGSRSA